MRYITVKDLSFYYDREPVLEGVNYYLDSGEFVTLTGENGAAKSTLIKASLIYCFHQYKRSHFSLKPNL